MAPRSLALASAGLLLASLAGFLGCAPERPTTIPVSGTVTFNGGPPPAPCSLVFAPMQPAEGYPRRGATAQVAADGTYTATTFTTHDGLIPGTYRVTVDCWKEPPDMANPASGVSYVAPNFERPEITINVDDKAREVSLEVPMAK